MPGYWWQCKKCGEKREFREAANRRSVPDFLWEDLVPAEWDQALLTLPCPTSCGSRMHLTYKFPRSKGTTDTVMVVHIVGLQKGGYLPMMWEAFFLSEPASSFFDFKYVRGKSMYGLNRPAILTQQDLREMFELYSRVTGSRMLP